MILLDADWMLIYANRTARRVSYIQAEEIGCKTLWQKYPEIVGTPLEQIYREVATLREERRVPAFYYETFKAWYDIRILPIDGGLAIHYQDTTLRRAAEAARDASAEQLNQALEANTDTVVAVDRNWCISYMNSRARTMLAPSHPAIGANLWEMFPAALEQNLPFVEHYRRAMDEGLSSEFEAFYPAPLNMWIKVMARPAKDGIIVFSRDITEQKRTAAALIQSEKLAAVGRLASSIAHEINNPLESVTNLIYIIRQDPLARDVDHCLELADLELRRISMIASQTLRFHKQSSRPACVTCLELFSSVLTVYDGRLKSTHIGVEKRKRAQRPVVCLEGEIRQVLNNLVGNAIDAMAGSGRLIIRSREGTHWPTGRKGLVLTVADTGGGIDSATQARMFEAFYTTKGEDGNGLGLWISAGIVDRHHGSLRFRSSQDRDHHGTVAALFLPFGSPLELAARSVPSSSVDFRCDPPPAEYLQGNALPA